MSKEPQPHTPSKLGRRLFLSAGSSFAALFSLPKLARAQVTSTDDNPNTVKDDVTASVRSFFQKFSEPPPISSINGVATADLRLEPSTFKYQGPNGVITNCTRSYNGWVPGPTFLVSPGDRIEIEMQNTLVGNLPDPDPGSNAPRHFNTTNLHFHGLHVSPSSYCQGDKRVLSSDDVLYELDPRKSTGESPPVHQWCVWLPEFHAPGTHWYHAHLHGATGLQVSNGMAGAIVVREPNKELNMVAQTEDKVWLLQEVLQPKNAPTSCSYVNGKPDFSEDGNVYGGGGTWDYLINGTYQPTIEMKAGQTQRWRFINATSTPRGLMTLKLAKASGPNDTTVTGTEELVDMYLVAVDGISFYEKPPEAIGPSNKRSPQRTGWDFASGNRADFLVNLPAGYYKVIKEINRGQQRKNPNTGQIQTAGGISAQVLAIAEVQPSTFNEKIPTTIPGSWYPFPYLKPITEAELPKSETGQILRRNIAFSVKNRGAKGYVINKALYESGCANIEVKLGTCEEWTLTSEVYDDTPQTPQTTASHPFHIHVNPFQIVGDLIDPNGPNDPSNWRWWDTIAVPQNEVIKIRNRFCDYGGEFVIHCHILIHEDQGMMMNVVVKDPDGKGAKPCWSLDRYGASEPSPLAEKAIDSGATVCTPSFNNRDCTTVPLQ